MKNNADTRKWTRVLYILSALGLFMALFIGATDLWPDLLEVCGLGGGSCSNVFATPYARLFGVSIAWWGALAFVALSASIRLNRSMTLFIVSAMMGFEVYLIWVQGAVLGIWCKLCLVEFVLVTILFFCALGWARAGSYFVAPGGVLISIPIVFAVFALFALPAKFQGAKLSSSPAALEELVKYAGPLDARVRVEIFSDYLCPHCKDFEVTTEKILENHPDVLVIFREMILNPRSFAAQATAYATGVALKDGAERYLAERSNLFENQNFLYQALKLKYKNFNPDEEMKEKISKIIATDAERAAAMKINSTPTTIVSVDGAVVKEFEGNVSYETIAPHLGGAK